MQLNTGILYSFLFDKHFSGQVKKIISFVVTKVLRHDYTLVNHKDKLLFIKFWYNTRMVFGIDINKARKSIRGKISTAMLFVKNE